LSTNALLESREEHDRIQAAAEAERAAKAEDARNAAASGSGSKRREAVGWSKPTEGEDIELDKARLKKAIDEEKKRKNLTEDELVARAKKSKSDVTNEEMGMFSVFSRVMDDY
jgi:pre-mRNA-processing factor SLU7